MNNGGRFQRVSAMTFRRPARISVAPGLARSRTPSSMSSKPRPRILQWSSVVLIHNFGVFSIPKPADIGSTIANITFGGGLVGVRNYVRVRWPRSAAPPTFRRDVWFKRLSVCGHDELEQGIRHSFVMGAEYKHLVNKVPFLPLYQGQFTFSNASEAVPVCSEQRAVGQST